MATRNLTKAQRFFRWFSTENGQKWMHRVPALAVFGVAAWQSYWHTVEVAAANGEAASAYMMPFGIDGLLVVAHRYASQAKTRGQRIAGWGSFAFGVFATLAINLLAADPHPTARFLAALPAAGLVLCSFMLHRPRRAAQRRVQR